MKEDFNFLIRDLFLFIENLNIYDIKYDFLIEVCKKEIDFNAEKYTLLIKGMIEKIISFIKLCWSMNYDGFCVYGV